GRDADGHFIVMEHVPGQTLKALIERAGPQPLRYVIDVGRQLCRALEAAHRQRVIHRDVKPSNILLTPSGTPKLVDFGLASALMEEMAASPGGLGTPLYAAPEQLIDAASVDSRADVYSLGVTLFEMLTGKRPAESPGPPPQPMGDILRK